MASKIKKQFILILGNSRDPFYYKVFNTLKSAEQAAKRYNDLVVPKKHKIFEMKLVRSVTPYNCIINEEK